MIPHWKNAPRTISTSGTLADIGRHRPSEIVDQMLSLADSAIPVQQDVCKVVCHSMASFRDLAKEADWHFTASSVSIDGHQINAAIHPAAAMRSSMPSMPPLNPTAECLTKTIGCNSSTNTVPSKAVETLIGHQTDTCAFTMANLAKTQRNANCRA